jgi:hypothetical protein
VNNAPIINARESFQPTKVGLQVKLIIIRTVAALSNSKK